MLLSGLPKHSRQAGGQSVGRDCIRDDNDALYPPPWLLRTFQLTVASPPIFQTVPAQTQERKTSGGTI